MPKKSTPKKVVPKAVAKPAPVVPKSDAKAAAVAAKFAELKAQDAAGHKVTAQQLDELQALIG